VAATSEEQSASTQEIAAAAATLADAAAHLNDLVETFRLDETSARAPARGSGGGRWSDGARRYRSSRTTPLVTAVVEMG
jgi:hypothetical protein